MTWRERALEARNGHMEAGLGEAPSFAAMMERLREQETTRRMRWLVLSNQRHGGFMPPGTFEAEGRKAGYRRG